MLRVLFAGGGSVGHLAPSIAVFEALQRKRPESSALFLCSARSTDRAFLREENVHARVIHAPKAVFSPLLLFFPFLFLFACIEALLALLSFKPHIIFAKGGYVCVPVCLMGWLLNVPIVLHESDTTIGRGNRFVLRLARHLCIGSPQKEALHGNLAYRRGMPVTATGNPVRAAIERGTRDGGRRVTGFSGNRPVLLVMGGSQGADVLNDIVRRNLETLLTLCDVIHLTGKGKARGGEPHARYFEREFVTTDHPDLLALADLVLCRAGAGTIAELALHGRAVILVPIPTLAHGHQVENARFLALAKAAIVLPQEELEDRFLTIVKDLLADEAQRHELGKRLHTFAVPDAADRIANILLSETQEKNPSL